MGYRLSYCTEYKVKHSSFQIGNHATDILNNLLYWLSCKCDHVTTFWFNEEELDYSSIIEINKDEVEGMIKVLKDMIDTNTSWKDVPVYISVDDDEELAKLLAEQGIPTSDGDWSMCEWLRNRLIESGDWLSPQYLYDFLTDALKNAEPTINYIRFEWL